MHRDIKPKNILMASHQRDSSLQIADFGFARRLKAGAARPAGGATTVRPAGGGDSRELAEKRRRRRTSRSFLGTAEWMAPEILICAADEAGGCVQSAATPVNPRSHGSSCLERSSEQAPLASLGSDRRYSFPADVWAAGCVIYSLLMNDFNDSGPFFAAAESAEREARKAKGRTAKDLKALFLGVLNNEVRSDIRLISSLARKARLRPNKALFPFSLLPRTATAPTRLAGPNTVHLGDDAAFIGQDKRQRRAQRADQPPRDGPTRARHS